MPDYGWNETAQRYVDLDTGRFVSSSAVRDALEDVMSNSRANMNAITQELIDGSLSLSSWQKSMMEQIKLSHTAAAASANGGWAQMTQSDWGYAGSLIKDQYSYLRGFADQLADGTQALDGRALMRADMYAEAARGTYEAVRMRGMVAEGFDEARRVLGPADHCPDCLEYASEGWMPVEDVPAIGDSVCLTNCFCEIEYRKSGETETSDEE